MAKQPVKSADESAPEEALPEDATQDAGPAPAPGRGGRFIYDARTGQMTPAGGDK